MALEQYVPLLNITLSQANSSVTFSSISQAYRDLVIIMGETQTTRSADSSDATGMRFNNDSGGNYSFMYMFGDGSSAGSAASGSTATSIETGHIPTSTTTLKGNNIIQIFDYSATDKHKSVLTRSNQSTGYAVKAHAGRWSVNTAINTVTLFSVLGSNFVSGSTFALYGVR